MNRSLSTTYHRVPSGWFVRPIPFGQSQFLYITGAYKIFGANWLKCCSAHFPIPFAYYCRGTSERVRPAAEVLTLERRLSDIMNVAYGPTPEEAALMWRTVPPPRLHRLTLRAGDEGGVVGGEKDDTRGDFVGHAEPTDRVRRQCRTPCRRRKRPCHRAIPGASPARVTPPPGYPAAVSIEASAPTPNESRCPAKRDNAHLRLSG